MKKTASMLLVAAASACALLFQTGCSVRPGEGARQTGGAGEEGLSLYSVVGEQDGLLFLVSEDGLLCRTLALDDVPTDPQCGAWQPSAGDIVTADLSPAPGDPQCCELTGISFLRREGHEPSAAAMYTDFLRHLLSEDTGVGEDIKYLGVDFSGAHNLTEGERLAVAEIISREYGLQLVTGTFSELCRQGLIDDENMFFPEGILLSIESDDGRQGGFEFSGERWRGGRGAVFLDCAASLSSDGAAYGYEVTGYAIS